MRVLSLFGSTANKQWYVAAWRGLCINSTASKHSPSLSPLNPKTCYTLPVFNGAQEAREKYANNTKSSTRALSLFGSAANKQWYVAAWRVLGINSTASKNPHSLSPLNPKTWYIIPVYNGAQEAREKYASNTESSTQALSLFGSRANKQWYVAAQRGLCINPIASKQSSSLSPLSVLLYLLTCI